jgi:hypothetical protein
VSEQIAQRTNVWSTNTTKTAADDHPSTIAIDAATCLEYFETVNRLQTSHRDFFSQTLDVVYEDLLKNYEGEMDRVQRFLGVPVRTLRSPLKKQSKSPLNVTLSNFSELETKFRNTPWSRYFEMQT